MKIDKVFWGTEFAIFFWMMTVFIFDIDTLPTIIGYVILIVTYLVLKRKEFKKWYLNK